MANRGSVQSPTRNAPQLPPQPAKLYADLTRKLKIDPYVVSAGQRLLGKLLEKNLDEMQADTMGMILCVLYVEVLNRRTNTEFESPRTRSGSRLPALHTLLRNYDKGPLHVVKFIHKLKILNTIHPEPSGLPERVLCRMIHMEKSFTICSAVFHKFEKILPEIFRHESDIETDSGGEYSYEDNRRLCWVLFLYAKDIILHNNYELILAFHLFLCCLDHVIRSKPSYTLKSPYDEVVQNYLINPDPHCVLKTLCDQIGINYDELCSIQVEYWDPLVETIPNRSDLPDVAYLEQAYQESYLAMGELDEMMFLEYDPVLVAKGVKEKNGKEDSSLKNSSLDNESSLQASPATPIKSALQTVYQLTRGLESIADGPSEVLKNFFTNCSIDPTRAILDRVRGCSDTFVTKFTEVTSSASGHSSLAQTTGFNTEQARQRMRLATRLYYRVLENMLLGEKARLSQNDFSTFLDNQTFHRALLANSVEVVLAAYGQSSGSILTDEDLASAGSSSQPAGTVSFPWVLSLFDVKPFDFFRVCESFIRAETSLPKDLIKHINSIETKILECLAWQSGSPLFDAIRMSETMPSAIPSSPVYHRTADAVSGSNAPANGSSSSREQNLFNFSDLLRSPTKPHSSTLLKCFFNKVSRLAYQRLLKFCSMLNVTMSLQHKMWTCLQHVICNRPDLMRDRHVDQMIMCSIYAMCRVSDRDVKFKTLVSTYRANFPHCTQDVYKAVLTLDGKKESIIAFYNDVFSQSMKPYLLQFSPTRQQMPSLSPIPLPPSSSTSISSPRQTHSQRCNVSLLNESPFRHHLAVPTPPLTPRTSRLYCFGESPGPARSNIHSINEAVRSGVSRNLTPSLSLAAAAASTSASMEPGSSPSRSTASPRGVTRRRRLGFENPGPESSRSSEEEDTSPPVVKQSRDAAAPDDAQTETGRCAGNRSASDEARTSENSRRSSAGGSSRLTNAGEARSIVTRASKGMRNT